MLPVPCEVASRSTPRSHLASARSPERIITSSYVPACFLDARATFLFVHSITFLLDGLIATSSRSFRRLSQTFFVSLIPHLPTAILTLHTQHFKSQSSGTLGIDIHSAGQVCVSLKSYDSSLTISHLSGAMQTSNASLIQIHSNDAIRNPCSSTKAASQRPALN